LRACAVDDCELKLSEHTMRRLQSEVDWKKADPRPAVDGVMRQFAFDFVTAYIKGGDRALPVYRDRGRPISPAAEFRDMVEHMEELPLYGQDLRRYLVEFPAVTLPNVTSFLYWQETEFGLKPIIRISHLTIRQGPTETIVASKMLYATHYFWTALDLRALIPDPARGAGFWLLTTSRSRTDGLSGLTGLFIRRRVRSEVVDGRSKCCGPRRKRWTCRISARARPAVGGAHYAPRRVSRCSSRSGSGGLVRCSSKPASIAAWTSLSWP
jgi:hypothetical protein